MQVTEDIEIPLPQIKLRTVNPELEKKAIAQGLHPILARIIAARPMPLPVPRDSTDKAEPIEPIEPIDILYPKISKLSDPNTLVDMDKASDRVCSAIINQEYIGLETDHDCDGQTAHAILYFNLVNHFKHPTDKIKSYIGHRLEEGYGLSESVALRILNDTPRPTLVITADNGSADEPRIKKLHEQNIDVIVTDHHQIPNEGTPKSAFACLNPTREDCNFNDKYIAGCMVAWLLMVVVRYKLIALKYLNEDAPKLSDTLDFVALGTIADCVSMAQSYNNRIVVAYGLKLIEQEIKPCWQALKPILNTPVNSEDLAFKIGPLLNSDGRLSSAFGSVSFLLSQNLDEANLWIEALQEQNIVRKSIQKEITKKGILQAITKIKGKNPRSLCIFLEDGHVGVQGICASRIKDMFGRPTAFLAPKFNQETLVTGSLRGIDSGFHVRDALQFIEDKEPGLLISFGGHKGAGGLTIQRNSIEKFAALFEEAASFQLANKHLGPVIFSDGELFRENLNIDFINLLKNLEPFGREFETPIFHANALITNIYPIGDGSHLKFSLKIDSRYFKAVWFNIVNNRDGNNGSVNNKSATFPFSIGDNVIVAFSLSLNVYQGIRNCELMLSAMNAIESFERC